MSQTLPLSDWISHQRPDNALIAWHGETTFTVADLRHDVLALLTELRQIPSQRWALCFEDSYLFLVALLAVLYAGKRPVIPGHSRIALLEEQQALFEGVISEQPLSCRSRFLQIRRGMPLEDKTATLPILPAGGVVELFTSGSTGQPRRVLKPITCLERESALLAAHFGQRLQQCRVIASVVPQHLYGLTFRIFLPMSMGLPLHTAMLYYAEQLSALEREYRYLFISSPAFLKRLDHQLAPPKVEMLISAGGVLPWQEVLNTQAWLGVIPDEIYGSTETGVVAWRYRQQDKTAWVPFPGLQFQAEEEAWRVFSPLIPQQEGLLLDDNLKFDDKGCFHLNGRRGRTIKIEEKRVSLCEVEQRLEALEGICEAVALPVSRGGRQGIGAILVLNEPMKQAWQQQSKQMELVWRRKLVPWLEPVAIPRFWRVVDAIPVNSMNKRVYTQLQEFFHEGS